MKRAILLGDSPFLGEVENKVQYALERCYSLGINRVITRFRTSGHAFVDPFLIRLTNENPDLFSVSLYKYGDLIAKTCKDLYDSYAFDFSKDSCEDLLRDNKLAWCGFTHDYALSYLIIKGYDDIILLGTADFTPGPHYSNPYDLKCSDKLKLKSKKFIEEICCRKANIRTCNDASILEIPRISIDELLI